MLTGTDGADVIVALGGNDVVLGLGGNDVVCAGDGVDVVAAGTGSDTVLGQAGVDLLAGEAGDDVLAGGEGIDVLAGGPGPTRCSAGRVSTCCPAAPAPTPRTRTVTYAVTPVWFCQTSPAMWCVRSDRTHLNPRGAERGAGRDGDAVPGVDHDRVEDDLGQLGGVEVTAGLVDDVVGHVGLADELIASVRASAARSRSVNSGTSRQACSTSSRCWDSPSARAFLAGRVPRQRWAPPGSIARTVSIVSASSGPLSSR